MPGQLKTEPAATVANNQSLSVISCTRKLQFCAGHRVMGHENKCAHLHGHNYVIYITAEAASLDDIGRVIDFSVLKNVIGEWIENHWDHGFLLYEKDFQAVELIKNFLDGNQKHYLLSMNPTAENLASFILNLGNDLLKEKGINIVKTVVWETPNCYAEASLDRRDGTTKLINQESHS